MSSQNRFRTDFQN